MKTKSLHIAILLLCYHCQPWSSLTVPAKIFGVGNHHSADPGVLPRERTWIKVRGQHKGSSLKGFAKMFSSEHHEGRLIELRMVSPFTLEEAAALYRAHVDVISRLAGDFIVAVDLRRAFVFPPQVTDQLIALATQLNPRLLRSAILINHSAVLGLQAERAVQEAGNPNRRTFRDPAELELWFAEILTQAELSRLHEFLTAGSPVLASAQVNREHL